MGVLPQWDGGMIGRQNSVGAEGMNAYELTWFECRKQDSEDTQKQWYADILKPALLCLRLQAEIDTSKERPCSVASTCCYSCSC
jgi:hypothetical protein